MKPIMARQGQPISAEDLRFVRQLIRDHPSWNRTRISERLCQQWHWIDHRGKPRDMACRTVLLKLHRAGHIVLPPPQRPANNDYNNWHFDSVDHDTSPVETPLSELLPISLTIAGQKNQRQLLKCLLNRYHYIGYQGSPGKSIWYLAHDKQGRLVACMIFAAAARRLYCRDQFISWSDAARARNLYLIGNQIRFLILPHVKVHNLASKLLSVAAQRISNDYQQRYGHGVVLLESFVDSERFTATCYRAANWVRLGQSSGRTRNDQHHRINSSIKEVYVYALSKHFREILSQ